MLLIPTYLGVSMIHGIGCFAAERIAKGTPVWRFVRGFDRRLSLGFVLSTIKPGFVDRYIEQCPLTRDYLLCCDDARFINHATDPNVLTSVPLFHPRKSDCAARDIEKGEELTMDYRITNTRPFAGFAHEVTNVIG